METPREQLKKHLQDNTSFEDYNPILKPTLGNLYLTFRNEYFNDNELKRQGGSVQKVITEWLRGLPSCVSFSFSEYMPYGTPPINSLMYALGYDVLKEDDPDVDDLYWSELGVIIYESR